MRAAIYNEDTGAIIRIVDAPADHITLQVQEGEAYVVSATATDEGHYFNTELTEIHSKMDLPIITTNTPLIADGADEVIISGIPSGVQVQWPDGQTDIVTDGEIRFSVDLPGTYTFQFTAIPYLDKEVTIEAVAAT